MTRLEREKLNALSKQLFGSSSKWQTMLKKGKRVKRDNYTYIESYTLEEITTLMETRAALPTTAEIAELIQGVTKKE